MKIEQAFGTAIKRLRNELELSQDALSLTSQLDRTFISLIECGRKNPTLITIIQLARGLNVSTERILREVEAIMAINCEPLLVAESPATKKLPEKGDFCPTDKLVRAIRRSPKKAMLLVENEDVIPGSTPIHPSADTLPQALSQLMQAGH